MLRKIQKYLLLNHPLIWNVKFVPLLAITLLINLIFFVFGYTYGRIDFLSLTADDYRSVSGFTAFFGIVTAIIVTVVWLVFYMRNNGFKSFYPKDKTQLYKEWLLILVICILNCNFNNSFEYAYKLRARNYIAKEEALKKMDIISRSAVFIEGSYRPVDSYETDKTIKYTDNYYGYEDYTETAVEEVAVREIDTIAKDSVCYYGNLYHEISYMNKNTEKFGLQEHARDSVNEFKVKRWLYDQKEDSIKKVIDNFLALAKEHNLKANITSEKWMNIVYHPKYYAAHVEVGKDSLNPIGDENIYEGINDSLNNQHIRIKNENVAVPKYHVPFTQLNLSYTRISEAWENPYSPENIFTILYFAFAASLLIFSFRVTSGKSWLIAAVAFAITGLVTFIFTMIARHGFGIHLREEVLFTSIWLIIIALIGIWFIKIYRKKQSKKLSYILVNLLSWLLPTILPILWFVVLGYVRYGMRYYDYDYENDIYATNDNWNKLYEWMNDHFVVMFTVNLVIILLYMYPFSKVIRKWKGIAEG